MRIKRKKTNRRATILVMIVGLLATLFLIVTAYITLARFDKLTLEAVQQGETVDQVLGSLNAVILSAIRQSWADADGNLLAGGRSDPDSSTSPVLDGYAPIDGPGYRGTAWLARSEPVRDARFLNLEQYVPFDQLWFYTQTASSFVWDPSQGSSPFGNRPLRPGPAGVYGLMLEDGTDGDPFFEELDILPNVRRPFMDADGDGVPDSAFVAMSSLTEMANAIGGIPVHAPDFSGGIQFNPAAIGIDSLAWQWHRFDQRARYEVAIKVISNSGMVALASPGEYTVSGSVWNREFVTEMFNWVRHPQDVGAPDLTQTQLNDLHASAAAVEPFLRHRGGLLVNHFEENLSAVPSVLARLREEYERTFQPLYLGLKADASQRFNLADIVQGNGEEWDAWRQSVAMDPTAFNASEGGSAREGYNRRHLLTAISNSDELARVISPDVVLGGLGIHPGQLKFYLGDVYRAFDTLTGNFVWLDPNDPMNVPRGKIIIERLANYYSEMLRDYEEWQAPTGGFNQNLSEAVSLQDQAYMLAVNTVAFAAPRQPPGSARPGFIDVVRYRFQDGRFYTGYAPQPFITQVLAYNKTEGEPPNVDNDIALAVELYYPHDPGPDYVSGIKFNNPSDRFALDLSQFALTLNDGTEGDYKFLQTPLDPFLTRPVRLSGRNFMALAISDMGGNTQFNNIPGVDGVIADWLVTPMTLPGGNRGFTIKLWRFDSLGVPSLVDEFVFDFGETYPDDEREWNANAHRDTNRGVTAVGHVDYFGGDWDGDQVVSPSEAARWRVVSSIGVGEADVSDGTSQLEFRESQIGNAGPETTQASAPAVPLYTMNANLGQRLIHGAWRPNSFPTVGFMLFIPRFSHMHDANGSKTMSEILRMQWEDTDNNYAVGTEEAYPADFGHMPIFDNRQEVKSGPTNKSYFADSRAGRVPWGLLAYDFFTTLNPNADDFEAAGPPLDPRRVPGRINVNTAPWYILAGLPVLNPGNEQAPGAIDQSASPAFWSTKSGVFVGASQIGFFPGSALPRFDYSMLTVDPQAGWLRLGAQLGQAVASYRDRIRYVEDAYTSLQGAEWRNDPPGENPFDPYRYRRADNGDPKFAGYAYGQIRRANGAHGFLSLGELINVAGFDSAVRNVDPQSSYWPLGIQFGQAVKAPDFFKAVSLMALLDTHFLTTRGNTFTVYVSVMDRENPQASIRSQLTVDRSNLLPQLLVDQYGSPILEDDQPIVTQDDGLPEIVTQRQIGYYNTQFDQ